MYVCVFVCGQSCGSVLPWTSGYRLTVCESDTSSSNPAQCSFFLFFLSYHILHLNVLACTYTCVAKLVTWGVGPDVNYFGIVIASLVCMQPSQTNLPHADTVSDPCWGILNWERDSVKCDHSTFNNIV